MISFFILDIKNNILFIQAGKDVHLFSIFHSKNAAKTNTDLKKMCINSERSTFIKNWFHFLTIIKEFGFKNIKQYVVELNFKKNGLSFIHHPKIHRSIMSKFNTI